MVGMKMGDRLGASGYVKKGKAHPRRVMRNRRGFDRADDTRDGGRHRRQARKDTPTLSALRGRAFRDRMPSVERLANSLKQTALAAIRGGRADPRFPTRCWNWVNLVETAKQNQRNPSAAAALRNRTEPEIGRDVVAIPLPTAGRQHRKVIVGTLAGTDKGQTSSWAYVDTHDARLCIPMDNVFGCA